MFLEWERNAFFSNTYNIITFKYLEIKRIHRNMQSVRNDIYKILTFMHLIIILLVLDTPYYVDFFKYWLFAFIYHKIVMCFILKINIFFYTKKSTANKMSVQSDCGVIKGENREKSLYKLSIKQKMCKVLKMSTKIHSLECFRR